MEDQVDTLKSQIEAALNSLDQITNKNAVVSFCNKQAVFNDLDCVREDEDGETVLYVSIKIKKDDSEKLLVENNLTNEITTFSDDEECQNQTKNTTIKGEHHLANCEENLSEEKETCVTKKDDFRQEDEKECDDNTYEEQKIKGVHWFKENWRETSIENTIEEEDEVSEMIKETEEIEKESPKEETIEFDENVNEKQPQTNYEPVMEKSPNDEKQISKDTAVPSPKRKAENVGAGGKNIKKLNERN